MKKLKILFFGRKNDIYSIKCLEHLKNLNFDISVMWSKKRGEKLQQISNTGIDYILCYRSYFILPRQLLKKPRFYSINFHPSPPTYPGSGGLNFALYNNDRKFGVTIHLMNNQIDSGDIIITKNFKINNNDNVESLLKKTHDVLLNSFINFTNQLEENGEKYIKEMIKLNKNISWSKIRRKIKELDDYQEIDKKVSKLELKKRIRAFHTTSFPLKIKFHNEEFILKK